MADYIEGFQTSNGIKKLNYNSLANLPEKVLYDSDSDYGIYCDGSTTANSNNSILISDPSYTYKRFRICVRTPYGIGCTDMPVDRAVNSGRTGGIYIPSADKGAGNYATKNYIAKLDWCITKEDGNWRIQVTDSGWLNLNVGQVTNTNYTGNIYTEVVGTNYISWNQRHNQEYSIYRIVGYII